MIVPGRYDSVMLVQRAALLVVALGTTSLAHGLSDLGVVGAPGTLHARTIIVQDELGIPGEWIARVETGHLVCVAGCPAETDRGDEVEIPILVMVPADGPATTVATVTVSRGGHAIESRVFVIERRRERADLNGDGRVDSKDMAALLAAWGTVAPRGSCDADLDLDGRVDGRDLSVLVASWHS